MGWLQAQINAIREVFPMLSARPRGIRVLKNIQVIDKVFLGLALALF